MSSTNFVKIQAIQSNIASSIDFNQFRCTLCRKYLSVPPIHMLTDQPTQGQNICGRCKIQKDDRVSRNVAFEAMAQYLEFPCSNSNTCPQKLRWGEVETHEDVCGVKTVRCIICNNIHAITKIESHFAEQHREKLFYDSVLVVSEQDIGQLDSTNQFLMATSNELYIISTETNSSLLTSNIMLTIKVTALLESLKFQTYTITFNTKNNTTVFKNKPITSYNNVDDWVDCSIFNLTTLKKLFLPDEGNLNIALRFQDQVTKPTKIKNQTKANVCNKDMKETSTLFEKVAQDLECPICIEIMSRNIIVCERGHSICEECKNSCARVCPICKSLFTVNRNFALEEVCKKLKDFVI